MSAWYVLSALGFYPVNPVGGSYILGSPLINKAIIHSEKKTFTIKVENNSKGNPYIQSISLNGNPYPYSFLLHKDIVAGGELVITMGGKPNANWGVAKSSRPNSF